MTRDRLPNGFAQGKVQGHLHVVCCISMYDLTGVNHFFMAERIPTHNEPVAEFIPCSDALGEKK